VSELERDRTAFLSEDYESEVGEANKFVLEYINELRGRPKDKQQLSLFKPEDFVERRDEIIRTFVRGDTKPPYVVNTSKLKSPQNIVLVSHSPEKEFVFQLIDNSDYIDSWIKSPDKNFYSIDYEYWKRGKDRVRRSFNPDFFIKIDLDEYISRLESKGKQDYLENLRKLQDEGIETLIKVVEIKSDEEQDEATPKKEEYAKGHFEQVNSKLSTLNLADIESRYRTDAKQYYTFDLLTPNHFPRWFTDLKKGWLAG
jgi:type III restriction enzyme